MSLKPDLLVAPCSYQAAKYAVEHWHYSRSMPAGKRLNIGVWENNEFVGGCVFGYGIQQFLGKQFGLDMTTCVELCRVALYPNHLSQVSQVVSVSLRILKAHSSGLRLVVSYADVDYDHVGGIYQAGNWIYIGKVQINGGTPKFKVNGQILHGRQVHSLWGKGAKQIPWLRKNKDPLAEKVYTRGKHKYLYPLDRAMRRQIEPLAQPYPKREDMRATDGSTLATS